MDHPDQGSGENFALAFGFEEHLLSVIEAQNKPDAAHTEAAVDPPSRGEDRVCRTTRLHEPACSYQLPSYVDQSLC
jgi:hypothetical protein